MAFTSESGAPILSRSRLRLVGKAQKAFSYDNRSSREKYIPSKFIFNCGLVFSVRMYQLRVFTAVMVSQACVRSVSLKAITYMQRSTFLKAFFYVLHTCLHTATAETFSLALKITRSGSCKKFLCYIFN